MWGPFLKDEAWLNVVQGIKTTIIERRKYKERVGEGAELRSMHDLMTRFIDQIEINYNNPKEVSCTGIETGLTELDHLIDGLHPSQLVVIASRPNMGKADLALNIASHAALGSNLPVAYFTMSMTADQLTKRLVSMVSTVDAYSLSRGNLDDEQWSRTSSALGLLLESQLYIDESIFSSTMQLRDKCIALHEKHGLKLIVIDSIQHVDFNNDKLSAEYVSTAKQLKNLARELKIPIVVTSSLPMKLEERASKRPILNDLSECQELEEYADTVMFVYRDEMYNDDSPDKGMAEILIAKHMLGKSEVIKAVYREKNYCFLDYPNPSQGWGSS